MAKSAIVLFRHGCDNGEATGPGNFTLDENLVKVSFHGQNGRVDGNTIYYERDFLGTAATDKKPIDIGFKEKVALGKQLPDWINNQFQPVSRVMSEGPGIMNSKTGAIDGTPNPVNTVRPYIEAICTQKSFKSPTTKLTVDLYDNDSSWDTTLFSLDALFADGKGSYSTVISWEAKGMWRQDSGGYVPQSIIGQLSKHVTNTESLSLLNMQPYKCQIVYTFELQDDHQSLIMKIYEFVAHSDGSGEFNEITHQTQWPANKCS